MLYALLYFAVTAILVLLVLGVDQSFNRSYKLWEQVGQGNVAVGLAVAGKLIGLGIIAWTAISHSSGLLNSVVWTVFGAVLQGLGYGFFEMMTPRLSVGGELAAGNKAVGLVTMGIAVGLSLVVSACIA
ncbi:MAG: DUF350 domain-containing protein [Candidatus Sumerlaeaceae bacterium]|nr:DUF350 domain-containing protein [Candidatus Sumerlaeaceae bacterium]